MEKPRLLRAEEIDVRVGSCSKSAKRASFLLYKDARCDMNILDEWAGPMNWTRSHSRDNANCTVSIWDEAKGVWVSKEDTGTESNTEKEKGLASDSFKRACFNWGIGRELYTAPQIWINLNEKEYNGGKPYVRFTVTDIKYDENRCISELVIMDEDLETRFHWKEGKIIASKKAVNKKESGESEAAAEFLKCKTRADVTAVWNKYPQYHTEGSEFYNACLNRNRELKS